MPQKPRNPYPPMCRIPINALHQIDHDPKHASRPLRREMAAIINRSPSTFSRILSEEATMDYHQAADLARWTCDELGDDRFAMCYVGTTHLLLPKPFGAANGRYDDEAADLLNAGGQWVRHMAAGDAEAARRTLRTIQGDVLPRMDAEVDTL